MVGIPGEPDEGPVTTPLPHPMECNGSIFNTIELAISVVFPLFHCHGYRVKVIFKAS